MNRPIVAALALLPLIFGCDPQVDSSYRGEPLMTLRGAVVSSEVSLDSKLLPGLIYEIRHTRTRFTSDGSYWPEIVSDTQYYVHGEVEGQFPNEFTLSLYEPPPPEAMERWFSGEPRVAQAEIAAIPKRMPKWIRWEELWPPQPPGLDGYQGPKTDRLCTDENVCIESQDHCDMGSQESLEFPCGAHYPDHFPYEVRGKVEGLKLFFAEAPIPEGSYTARAFNHGKAIPAGYSLLKIDAPDWTDPEVLRPGFDPCSMERDADIRRLQETAERERLPLEGEGGFTERVSRFVLDHLCENDEFSWNSISDLSKPLKLVITDEPVWSF